MSQPLVKRERSPLSCRGLEVIFISYQHLNLINRYFNLYALQMNNHSIYEFLLHESFLDVCSNVASSPPMVEKGI